MRQIQINSAKHLEKIPQNYSMEDESDLAKTISDVLLLFQVEAILVVDRDFFVIFQNIFLCHSQVQSWLAEKLLSSF